MLDGAPSDIAREEKVAPGIVRSGHRTHASQVAIWATTVFLAVLPLKAFALETSFSAPGASEELAETLRSASLALNGEQRGFDTPQEVIAAAQSDYGRLIGILYAQGYYGPDIRILLNGREAADIPPLNTPSTINSVEVKIDTGPVYRFGVAQIGPLAPETELPESFATGQPAPTPVLQNAATAAVSAWRDAGHAKAEVGDQQITANHSDATLDARIGVTPGPLLRFGNLSISGNQKVRDDAIRRIAGFPTGEVFDPELAKKSAKRLRRTGAFASVALTEADAANPDDTLDFTVSVAEQLPRRISFGGAIYSEEGLDLSFSWMHRNLFGGAEKLQFDSSVRNIGGTSDIDGRTTLRLDLPAKFGPDYDQFYIIDLELLDETYYRMFRAFVGTGVRRVFSEELFAEVSVGYSYGKANDAFGEGRIFEMLIFPSRLEWDERNDKISATNGYYLNARVSPFYGFTGTESGVYSLVDGRGYLGFGEDKRVVLAGRLQIGTVIGPSLSEIAPDMLFYSGGAGTVRGQPYQSLAIPVGNSATGGRSFLGVSAEIRGKITEKISLVGFYDFGAIDSKQWVDADSPNHSGAGLGVRYDIAGIGPIRLDLAYPVGGDTGDGLQFYIGIGQAF